MQRWNGSFTGRIRSKGSPRTATRRMCRAAAWLALLVAGCTLAAAPQQPPGPGDPLYLPVPSTAPRTGPPAPRAPASNASPAPGRAAPARQPAAAAASKAEEQSAAASDQNSAAAAAIQNAPPVGGFSLQNANLLEVIDQLAKLAKINYVLDPRVKGGVTLNTYGETKGVDPLTMLQTILRINGYAMIQMGNVYRIVPLVDLARMPIRPESQEWARTSPRMSGRCSI